MLLLLGHPRIRYSCTRLFKEMYENGNIKCRLATWLARRFPNEKTVIGINCNHLNFSALLFQLHNLLIFCKMCNRHISISFLIH